MGMVFQYSALFDSLNVKENVAFGLRMHTRLSEEKIDAIVKEKLHLVGLDGIEDLMPANLSGGMKKRVSLARAIALEPKIILYDPFDRYQSFDQRDAKGPACDERRRDARPEVCGNDRGPHGFFV